LKYPELLKRINHIMGITAGSLIVIIGIFSIMEGILRGLFSSPTTWSLNVSQYLLIWAVFLGSAYTFQERNHVAVEFIREGLGYRFGGRVRKILCITGYLLALIYVCVLLWNSIDLFKSAIHFGKSTYGAVRIPAAYLYSAMVLGSVSMAVTLAFIILNIFGGGKKYL